MVATVNLYDEGVERGEFADWRDGRPKKTSGSRTLTQADLGLDKRRLQEARTIRDSDCVAWFEGEGSWERRVALCVALWRTRPGARWRFRCRSAPLAPNERTPGCPEGPGSRPWSPLAAE